MQERLQKVLARAGIASRRRAEELITEGRVKVNDRKVTELGVKVDAARDAIRVDGALVADIVDRVYYVLYKPAGCVTTMSDPEGRATIGDWLRVVKDRVFPVGRLDYDAEGALIVTNDGELAHKLMHPKFGAHRTYLAKVKGSVPDSAIEALKEGVRLEDGLAKPLEAAYVEKADKNTWIRLVVDEGRPHLVKRLCEAVGHPVVRLFRASYAGIDVQGLMPGELRELSGVEIKRLRAGTLPDAGSSLPPRRDARSSTATPRWTPPPEKTVERKPAEKRPVETKSAPPARRGRQLVTNEHDFDDEPSPPPARAPAPQRSSEGEKRVFVKKTFSADSPTTRTYTTSRAPRPSTGERPSRPARSAKPEGGARSAPARAGKPRGMTSDRPSRGAKPEGGARSAPARTGKPRASTSDRPSRGAGASKAPRGSAPSGGRPATKGRGAPSGPKRSPRGRTTR